VHRAILAGRSDLATSVENTLARLRRQDAGSAQPDVAWLGGPNGPETAPTAWETAELLAEAVGRAAARVSVTVAGSSFAAALPARFTASVG
jgi:hypothetical protein